MKKFKLTGLFMMATLIFAVAAALVTLPFTNGHAALCLLPSALVVVVAGLMLEPSTSISYRKHTQAGEFGEDLRKVEQEYKEVNSSLKKISDELKAQAESSQKELKRYGDLSAEAKEAADKLLTQQGELNARLQAAEQKLVSLEDSGSGHRETVLSLGERLVQDDRFQAHDFGTQANFKLSVAAAITSGASSAGALVAPHRVEGIVAPHEQRLTVRDLISPGRTSSNMIEYIRETGFTNNADVVAEAPSNDKPESDIEFELVQAGVKTIAHLIRASKQILDDAPMLASYIDTRLRYGLSLKEESQLLKGSGVGNNLHGIFVQASNYVNPGVAVAAQTRIDQLRLALLQAELAEYNADGIVLSAVDWAAIELTKDSSGKYIFANPFTMSVPGLWSRPVVSTKSMDVGDFLVGAFKAGAQLFDREDANVLISTEDKDNFSKNMITIRAEERLALAVYRPEAFVKGEFEQAS